MKESRLRASDLVGTGSIRNTVVGYLSNDSPNLVLMSLANLAISSVRVAICALPVLLSTTTGISRVHAIETHPLLPT